ncbi:hypothetical protein M426DRAFT_20830 [Hypoxylon sp. CI-4A]|nr:hypothetical protein M426DRAFT_20830 [Hypoxylon sp. CI-4A]
MAHSPLLRTLMRFKLDIRSVALTNYELALEDVSVSLEQPPNKGNFDKSRWTDLRKDYENRKTRESRQKDRENSFIATLKRERKDQKLKKDKPEHSDILLQKWEKMLPTKMAELRLTLVRSGYNEWKPPSVLECLMYEQGLVDAPKGRVCVGETGILDRRALHQALSPRFVPKPHFKMERKRLEAKSAEFMDFVEKQASLSPEKRIWMPRPQDESSDDGLLSTDEERDENGGKRKRITDTKPKKRRRPKRFIKLYDCKVHDIVQLKAQGTNLFSLIQQKLPRVEIPPLELIRKNAISRSVEVPPAEEDDPEEVDVEDPIAEEVKVHGIILPVRLPQEDEVTDEEPQPPTLEDILGYQTWRLGARSFFEERDRYMQSRVYREQAQDRELSRAVQSLMGFWAKFTI